MDAMVEPWHDAVESLSPSRHALSRSLQDLILQSIPIALHTGSLSSGTATAWMPWSSHGMTSLGGAVTLTTSPSC